MSAPTTGTPLPQTIWRCDVDQDLAGGSGNWLQIKGATALAPVINPTTQDTTDFDAVGWGSDAITLRKAQVAGTVKRALYPSAFDPGQEFVRLRQEDGVQFHYRIWQRGSGLEAYDGWAVAQWTPGSGGPDAIVTADFVLLGNGIRNIITNPFGVGVVPVIGSVSPVTALAAGGQIVQIFGSSFSTVVQSAANVKFGATNATSFVVVSDNQIIAVAPAHATGAVAIVVTNPTGASTTGGTPLTYV